MTLQNFKECITKKDWYEKYFWYLVSFAMIVVGIYGLYDIGTNTEKYNLRNSYYVAIVAWSFALLLGCRALYLLPNRYKVLVLEDLNNIEKKKEIISELLDSLNIKFWDNQDTFYAFTYQRKWWTHDYDVYLGLNTEAFLITVLAKTSYLRGGFIDFGGSERLRNKLVFSLKRLILK